MKKTLIMKKILLNIIMLFPLLGFSQNSLVYITNEGNFGTGNGSLSIFNKINNSVTNNAFSSNNSGALLGDVVQSMEYFNNKGYICINNSSRIEIIDGNSNYVATISVSSPRYIKQVDANKAYVTDWGINGVQVIDLTTNSVTSTIACGTGPEGLTVSNGFAYICNVGGWGLDSTVTVINTTTDVVETTLIVGDKPNSSVVDVNGNVWVLTGGYTEYDSLWNVVSETPGVLAMINTTTNTVDASYTFPIGNHPVDLVINGAGDRLYYSDGSWSKAVYEFGITDTALASTPLINKSFYGLGYDPFSNEIYGSDAIDFVQDGWVFRYTSTGSVVDSFKVGIIPGSFTFREDVLSVEHISSTSISIFPNPTKGLFFVNSSEKINTLVIRNILGSVVFSSNTDNVSDIIDLSSFNKGVYLIELNTASGIITKKLIVE
ncbi:MAG: hypothetical protein CBC83_09825 [Flavobacteriales bacterium TMED123]|nr:MAG: hypothetical protein CBC83_09825 [Flavobacteriales bacterium TMED123]